MGTHALVGVEKQDGSVTGIYVHWNGDVGYTGKLLLNNYNSQELSEKLVSFGGDFGKPSKCGR